MRFKSKKRLTYLYVASEADLDDQLYPEDSDNSDNGIAGDPFDPPLTQPPEVTDPQLNQAMEGVQLEEHPPEQPPSSSSTFIMNHRVNEMGDIMETEQT